MSLKATGQQNFIMAIVRASKSEQTLLKHFSLKINRSRDTKGEKLLNQGVVPVFN